MLMAASFLLALGLGGWALNKLPHGAGTSPGSNQIAGNDRQVVPRMPGNLPQTLPQPKANSEPWQLVQLRAPALTGNNEPLQLPAMQRERLDDEYLKTIPDAVPVGIRQALECTGHVVRTHREFVPVPCKDGRQLVIPVDQIDVENDPYKLN
jgi:hypothetical protein